MNYERVPGTPGQKTRPVLKEYLRTMAPMPWEDLDEKDKRQLIGIAAMEELDDEDAGLVKSKVPRPEDMSPADLEIYAREMRRLRLITEDEFNEMMRGKD